MSVVGDLRQALQDVVAPDLKAVVAGLAALRDEVRSGNALLREEMKSGNALLREEMKSGNALLREEMKIADALLREEMKTANTLLRDEIALQREDMHSNLALSRAEMAAAEKRSIDRIDRIYDAIKIADLTRQNAELEAREQSRQGTQLHDPQQH